MNLDAQLALSPARVYRALVRESRRVALVPRLALTMLLLGSAVSTSAAERVTLGLVASTAVCWSFVAGIQVVIASLLIVSAPRRRSTVGRALRLFFLGHVPWSLWILTFGARAVVTSSAGGVIDLFLATALVPLVWTIVIVAAFCREVLGTSSRDAAFRTFVHQAFSWTVALLYVVVMVQAWPRLLRLVGP